MVYPKVSLILTTLNSLNNFTKTYSSIKEQNYPNIVQQKSTENLFGFPKKTMVFIVL